MPAQDEHADRRSRPATATQCRRLTASGPGKRHDDPADGGGATNVAGAATWVGFL